MESTQYFDKKENDKRLNTGTHGIWKFPWQVLHGHPSGFVGTKFQDLKMFIYLVEPNAKPWSDCGEDNKNDEQPIIFQHGIKNRGFRWRDVWALSARWALNFFYRVKIKIVARKNPVCKTIPLVMEHSASK